MTNEELLGAINKMTGREYQALAEIPHYTLLAVLCALLLTYLGEAK